MKRIRKIKIYLDTSVISALFDERYYERMIWTREFWKIIDKFNVFVSDAVIAKIQETPDVELKARMIETIKGLNIL